jgi:phage tail protein X
MALVLLAAAWPGQAVARPPERVLVYEVREGDFLRALARRFYGRTGAWSRIYRDNRKVIGPNPDRIVPGMRLRLADLPARVLVPDPPKMPIAKAPALVPTVLPVANLIPEPTQEPTPETTPSPIPNPPAADPPSLTVTQSFAPRPLEWLDFVPVGSSLVIAGSGQMMQGRWDKGGTHLSLMALSLLAFKTASDQGDRPMQALSGLGLLGIALWSPWDAFLNLSHGAASPSVTDSSRP